MTLPQLYVAFAVAYITLYFFGYPLRVLLLGGDLKKYDLYMTPWLGIGLIVTVLFPLSLLGFSVGSAMKYFALSVAAANAALWLKFREPPRVARGEAALIAAVAFVVATIYGVASSGNYAVTLNADFGYYLHVAKAVLISSAEYMQTARPGTPHFTNIYQTLNIGLRCCVFVHAAFAALYGLDLAHISYAVSAFVMFLNIIAFRLFLKGAGNFPVTAILLAILPFNVFYQSLVFMSYTGQLFSLGLVLVAFRLEFSLAEAKRFDPRTCALLAFALTANGLCYMEGMAFPLVPVASLLIVLLVNKNYDKKTCLQNAAFAGALYAAVNVRLLVIFVSAFLQIGGNPWGFVTHMPTLMDVAGLQGAASSPNAFLAVLISSNALLFYAIARQLRQEGAWSFLSVSCMTYFALHLLFCAAYFRPGDVSTYGVHKSALSLSFIAVVVVLRFLEDRLTCLLAGFPRRRGIAAALAFAVFFALNARVTWAELLQIPSRAEITINEDHDILKYFAASPSYAKSDFIINCDTPLLQFSAVYYLPFGRTYTSDYGGLKEDFARDMKDSFEPGDIYVTFPLFEDALSTTDALPLFSNGAYKIFRLSERSVILYDYKGFAHAPEVVAFRGKTVIRRHVTGEEIELEFLAGGDRAANFSMAFYDFGQTVGVRCARAYVNGKFEGIFRASGAQLDVTLSGVPLKRGVNAVKLQFDGDVSRTALTGLKIL
jgi:hypothetical protein